MHLFSKFFSAIAYGAITSVLVLGTASNASATVSGYAGVTFSSADLGYQATFPSAGTIGWSFSLSGNRTLSYFGLYSTDLNDSTTVSLWDSSGNLVASSVFDTSYTGVNTDDMATSGFLWKPTSNIALSAGTYTIGAFTNAEHFAATEGTISSTSGLQIISKSLVSFEATNTKPTDDLSSLYPNGLFGPNLRFAEAPAPVPVPGAVWLLGSGLLGLFGLKRVKKTA